MTVIPVQDQTVHLIPLTGDELNTLRTLLQARIEAGAPMSLTLKYVGLWEGLQSRLELSKAVDAAAEQAGQAALERAQAEGKSDNDAHWSRDFDEDYRRDQLLAGLRTVDTLNFHMERVQNYGAL